MGKVIWAAIGIIIGMLIALRQRSVTRAQIIELGDYEGLMLCREEIVKEEVRKVRKEVIESQLTLDKALSEMTELRAQAAIYQRAVRAYREELRIRDITPPPIPSSDELIERAVDNVMNVISLEKRRG